jgi:hypothetical protein
MKNNRPFSILLLLGLFLFSQTGCSYYQRYSMSKSRLQKINPEGLSVYLVDAAHPLTRGWYVAEPKFSENNISGFISRMAEVETIEASLLRDRSDARNSRNDILLYAKPQFALGLPDTATMTISNLQLEKIEVCEMNHVKTIGYPLLGCTGIIAVIFLLSEGIY